MRVLLTNFRLYRRTGGELFVRDLAIGLHRAGASPMVYSPRLGSIADEIASMGIPVVDRLRHLPARPDVLHLHNHPTALAARLRFPTIPSLYLCHHALDWMDEPPLLESFTTLAAVDRNCQERMLAAVAKRGVTRTVELIHNAVDLDRFQPRSALPTRPRRAAVFSNYVGAGDQLDAIRAACTGNGIELTVIGEAVGAQSVQPERDLPSYDLVFGKARCALEAMAVGCAVVVCDVRGLGPLVASDNVEVLRDWNFGMRLLRDRITRDGVAERIAAYDATDAARVSAYIRRVSGADGQVRRALELYSRMLNAPHATTTRRRLLREYAAELRYNGSARPLARQLAINLVFRYIKPWAARRRPRLVP